MNYFKDKKTNAVYAYDDEQLSQVSRLNELDRRLKEVESDFLAAKNELEVALEDLNQVKENGETDSVINEKKSTYESALDEFNLIGGEYTPLKNEYEAILPVFFDIRENLKVFKKMTDKDVNEHLNPPKSKEQYIAEAESKKQSLLDEANNAIAPLQDAVDLDIATDEEIASLKEWKKYRVLLNRVDASQAPDIDWPQKPTK